MNRRWLPRVVALFPLLWAGGCNWFEDPSPEYVQVMIESDADSLVLITSTQFLPTTNEIGELGVEVFASDTTMISFPFDRSWNIRDQNRFLLFGFPADSTTVTVRLRVLLDGDTDFDKTLLTSVEEPLRYIYLFNQQVVPDFDLL